MTLQQDEEGRLTFSVGVGAGQSEVVSRSCSGDFLSSRPVELQTVGAQIEYERSPFRVTAFGGSTSAEAADHDGGFVGALFALERDGVGFGLGPVRIPGDETVPSIYLRFGSRTSTFLQADFFAPDPTPGVTGLARVGVGFRVGATRGLAGVSTGRLLDLSDGDNAGPFAEWEIPLFSSAHLRVAGSWFFPEQHSDWALGASLRIRP